MILTVGEADAKFGRFSGVRGHRRPFRVSDLVFTERDSLALASLAAERQRVAIRVHLRSRHRGAMTSHPLSTCLRWVVHQL